MSTKTPGIQRGPLIVAACVLLVVAYLALQFIGGLLSFILNHPGWVGLIVLIVGLVVGGLLALASRDKS